MTTLTEVEDFVVQCKATGYITRQQRREADDLHRTLTNHTVYLDTIWRSEANEAKFHNSREWVEIIVEETEITLASVNAVMANPGTIPRQRQTESHGDLYTRHPRVNKVTPDVVKRTTIYNGAPHGTTCGTHSPPTRSERIPPTGSSRTPQTTTSQTIHNKVDTRPRNEKRGTPKGDCSLPHLMDVNTPLVSTNTWTPKRRDDHQLRMSRTGKRKLQPSTETQPPAKKKHLSARVTGGKPGGAPEKTHQPELLPIKQEPAPTDTLTAGNKPHMDALAPPDIKPDIRAPHAGGDEVSFLSCVVKGSRRMLIDDLETKTPRAGGKEKLHTQNINVPSTSRATTTRTPKTPGDKHQGNQCTEPCTTVAISRRTSRRTRNRSVLDIGRKDIDYVAAPMAQQDREGKIPSNTLICYGGCGKIPRDSPKLARIWPDGPNTWQWKCQIQHSNSSSRWHKISQPLGSHSQPRPHLYQHASNNVGHKNIGNHQTKMKMKSDVTPRIQGSLRRVRQSNLEILTDIPDVEGPCSGRKTSTNTTWF